MAVTTSREVEHYAAAVRVALADLPAAEREALLDGFTDHLAEIAGEPGGSLVSRLGPPDRYAAELRISAGLPPAAPFAEPHHATTWHGSDTPGQRDSTWSSGRHPGPPAGSGAGGLWLGWWVLRGYLLAVLAGWYLVDLFPTYTSLAGVPLDNPLPLPLQDLAEAAASGSLATLLPLIAIAVAIAVSVAVSLAARRIGRPPLTWLSIAADVTVVLLALGYLSEAGGVSGLLHPWGLLS